MRFRNFVLNNFPFLENDFDALTDYELFCKMVAYMKKSLEKLDGFQKQIDSFTVELNEFENYFNNLDVTEEVNAKLDEMVEDGTMEQLIAEYLQLTTMYVYNTVAELKAAENLVNNMFVKTYGYYSYDDGGGAYYKVRTKTLDDVVDDMFIIELDNENVVAELMVDNSLLIAQLGINTTASNNTTKLQAALEYVNDNKHIELVINKQFTVNTIDFTGINHITMRGENRHVGIKVLGDDGYGITLNTNLNTIKDICLTTDQDITLLKITGKYNHFINVRFYGSNADNVGIVIDNCWSNIFDDCDIREFNDCIQIINTDANYDVFNNCVIVGKDDATGITVYIDGGDDIVFNSCEIEKGVNNIKVDGGQCMFMNNYIEGASGTNAILLVGGNTIFQSNYFSNSMIGKYEANKLTLVNNIVRKVGADSYLLRCLESNIGYLVIENNIMKDENGYISNFVYANRNDTSPRYWNGSAWANGTVTDYIYVNQNDCYTVEPAGRHYVYIRKYNMIQGGTTSIRPSSSTEGLQAGQTYGDRTIEKLLFYNAYTSKWLDALGNTPIEKRNSVPNSGTYKVGDIIWNSAPSAGGNIGWVCIEAGTPGTWKSFGDISS